MIVTMCHIAVSIGICFCDNVSINKTPFQAEFKNTSVVVLQIVTLSNVSYLEPQKPPS